MNLHFLFILSIFFSFIEFTGAQPRKNQPVDILITNGKIMDGTGNPWFYGDISIKAGVIRRIGHLKKVSAKRTIDAKGLHVFPGFIDIHSHADDGFESTNGLQSDDKRRRAAHNLVAQGITTLVVNQDGRSRWPIGEQRSILETKKIGPNVILLFGHGTIRKLAMGDDFQREATPEEIKKMRHLARQAMDEGAFGASAGLEYAPGRWSNTAEVIAIMQEISSFHPVYISHQRSEGSDPMWFWPSQDKPGPPTLIDAILETIKIGEKTGVTVVASHIKVKGSHFWGSSQAAIQLIQKARQRGVQIYADQYPYNSSGTDGTTVLLPRWLFKDMAAEPDYAQKLRTAMADPELKEKIMQDIAHEIRRRGSADNIVVFEHPMKGYVGKSLERLAAQYKISALEMAVKLQYDGDPATPGGGRLRGFSMSEMDLESYAPKQWIATSSDAGIALAEDGPVHARFYGAFPRKISHYALSEGVISVEHAVRSMTSLPAQILNLKDRGQIREGFVADITIVDLKAVKDKATFSMPHQYPAGIPYVIVNGTFVVDGNKPTLALPGRVLSREELH